MIALTRKLNIENILIARKNIVKIKKFKKLMIFRISFEENKKILKFNNFWIRNVCFDNDFTAREIRDNNIRNKNQEYILRYQEWGNKNDEKDQWIHAFKIINKKYKMTRKK